MPFHLVLQKEEVAIPLFHSNFPFTLNDYRHQDRL